VLIWIGPVGRLFFIKPTCINKVVALWAYLKNKSQGLLKQLERSSWILLAYQ